MNVSKPTLHPGVQLTRRWVVEYFNGQNEQAAREFIAPAYTLEIGDHVFAGRDTQWLPAVAQQFAQFPGMGMTVHGLVVGSDRKAHHVGVWFSEHGASGGPQGPVAVWSGIGIYRSDGEKLIGCCAQEDYATRSRQLKNGVTDLIDAPHPAPWDTLPLGADLQAEAVVEAWLQTSWPASQPAVRVDDEHITQQHLVFQVLSVDIMDIFSSGTSVVFHARQTGFYQSGLPGVPARQRPEVLNVNGMVHVHDGAVVAGRIIRDRGGLKTRLLKDG